VVVDPAPRPRPILAQFPGGKQIRARDLGDPENPYLGQYDPWDYWLAS